MDSLKESFMVFTKIIIALLTVHGTLGFNQTISFFPTTQNCEGSNTSYSASMTTQNLTEEIKKAKSFLVELGAWRIFEAAQMSNDVGNAKGNDSMDGQNEEKIWKARICRSGHGKISRVERIGHVDLVADSITLYGNADYANQSLLVMNDIEKVDDTANRYRSWAITGAQNWGIYNKTKFEEEIVCLQASVMQTDFPVVTLGNANQTVSFSSIKAGCGSGSPDWSCKMHTIVFMTAVSLGSTLSA